MSYRSFTSFRGDTPKLNDLETAVVPGAAGYEGGTLLALPVAGSDDAVFLVASYTSFVLDYVARQKVGGTHLKYFTMKQLPILPRSVYDEPAAWIGEISPADWIAKRVLELSYTAWDIEPFARDQDDDGPPFRWDEHRRTLIRAELDAAYFHLYGLDRDEVEHVMDTFDVLRRREQRQIGEFRSKRLILDRYDAMAAAALGLRVPDDPRPAAGFRRAPRASLMKRQKCD
jgi:hypothetical protein